MFVHLFHTCMQVFKENMGQIKLKKIHGILSSHEPILLDIVLERKINKLY